eukprot:gb/GEZN01013140.1/.p1 GENE.gb/GEZN01013140.1/~~gb/GEZN01013140.1/.p1  ORF type:complete len:328 (+),score=52.54 gb/GEZN01013140.1/:61-984(+)
MARSFRGGPFSRMDSGAGKSGAAFWRSPDNRFLLKSMTAEECSFLLNWMPNYMRHMHLHSDSLLPRFYHCLELDLPYTQKPPLNVCLISNILWGPLHVRLKFDLKGAKHGRTVLTNNQQIEDVRGLGACPMVLKDMDLLSVCGHCGLSSLQVTRTLTQLDIDLAFLEQHHIFDYSLLLALAAPPGQEEHHSAYPIKDSSLEEEEQRAEAWRRLREKLERELLGEKEEDWLARHVDRSVQVQQSSNGSIVLLGLVDVLQPYTMRRKVESAFKSLVFESVCCVPPDQYRSRLTHFVESVLGRPGEEGQF